MSDILNSEYKIPASSRLRRTRMSEKLRRIVRETRLHPSDFILPLFISEKSETLVYPIASMPGVSQYGVESVLKICEQVLRAKLGGIILFGIPLKKDERGSEAYNENGIVPQALRSIKARFPELLVATDVCLCEYTDHGHCGILSHGDDGEVVIQNDESVELLCREALIHAEAGSDLIAPSDVMDGRIGAIRHSLDSAGFEKTPIMSYAIKHASGFYGPFRDAAESTPQFGDRRSHQMDSANSNEAMRAAERDLNEGADILMVKPALTNLDLIRQVKDNFHVPIAAYQVSGEYSSIKAAAERGWLDEKRVMMETLTAIKRAGASIILTYFALEAASLID